MRQPLLFSHEEHWLAPFKLPVLSGQGWHTDAPLKRVNFPASQYRHPPKGSEYAPSGHTNPGVTSVQPVCEGLLNWPLWHKAHTVEPALTV